MQTTALCFEKDKENPWVACLSSWVQELLMYLIVLRRPTRRDALRALNASWGWHSSGDWHSAIEKGSYHDSIEDAYEEDRVVRKQDVYFSWKKLEFSGETFFFISGKIGEFFHGMNLILELWEFKKKNSLFNNFALIPSKAGRER